MKRALPGLAAGLWLLGAPAANAADVMLDLQVGYSDLSQAKESAQAVLGSSGGMVFGAGIGMLVKEKVAVTLSVRRFDEAGERVFVGDPPTQIFPLGHPLSLRLTPVLLSLSYRFRPGGALTPYLGLGGGLVMFEEKSTVGGQTDTESATHGEFHGLAGLEYGPGRFRFGVELQYASVPGAIGVGGISELFGESNLGGFTALARIVFIPGR